MNKHIKQTTLTKPMPEEEKQPLKALHAKERVLLEATEEAKELLENSAYGVRSDDGRIQLSLLEALHLLERKKIVIYDSEDKEVEYKTYLKEAQELEPNFWVRYSVFKDLRNRGYIVKTALKFGADFRVYDRGIKPKDDHARWVVYPVHEAEQLTWFDFAAKNRVAHSTKKRLMMGIVDDEADVTYYEIKWTRP
ncbi:MAG: tRNA-intron lyase [Candidatus Woesearchaeota archaeon]